MFVQSWTVKDEYMGLCTLRFTVNLEEALDIMHRISEDNAINTMEKSTNGVYVNKIKPNDAFIKYLVDTYDLLARQKHLMYIPNSGVVYSYNDSTQASGEFRVLPKKCDGYILEDVTVGFGDNIRTLTKGDKVEIDDPHQFYLAQKKSEGNACVDIWIEDEHTKMGFGVKAYQICLEYQEKRHYAEELDGSYIEVL